MYNLATFKAMSPIAMYEYHRGQKGDEYDYYRVLTSSPIGVGNFLNDMAYSKTAPGQLPELWYQFDAICRRPSWYGTDWRGRGAAFWNAYNAEYQKTEHYMWAEGKCKPRYLKPTGRKFRIVQYLEKRARGMTPAGAYDLAIKRKTEIGCELIVAAKDGYLYLKLES